MSERGDTAGDARRGRTARERRLRTHALALVHPDARLVDAVERAKRAVIAANGGGEPDDGVRSPAVPAPGNPGAARHDAAIAAADALRAYAALALGEDETARTLIDRIVTAHDEASGRDVACLAAAWLTSRWYAWTGQAGAALPWLDELAECLVEDDDAAAAGAARTDLRRLAARELIALAEAGPDSALRTRMRRRAGGADAARSADAILGLLPAPEAPPNPGTVLADLLAGRTEPGAAGWASLALRDEPDAAPWVLPLLVAGVLGCDPDAERGRLRLRLHAPAAWPAWGVDRLRVGMAGIDVRVERSARHVAITADQVSGPLPLTLVLETTVHAPVAAAEVDGRPADLALRLLPDRVVAPVQLVLDAPRRVALRLGEPE